MMYKKPKQKKKVSANLENCKYIGLLQADSTIDNTKKK